MTALLAPFVYPRIPGPNTRLRNAPCFAFEQFDGSRICFFWQRQRGWFDAVTADAQLMPGSPLRLEAEALFARRFATAVPELLARHKEYRPLDAVVACCEFYGSQTFAGRHAAHDHWRLKLFDLYFPADESFMPPLAFTTYCAGMDIPRLVYQGPFNIQLVQDVYHNAFGIGEGAVIKGLRPNSGQGRALNEIWMVQVKTRKWLLELRRRAEADPTYDYAGTLQRLPRPHPQPK